MLPSNLKAADFANYSAGAKAIVISNLETIRQLPVSFVPSLLREVSEYDLKFPIECRAIKQEFAILGSLSSAELKVWFNDFASCSVSSGLAEFDWVNDPGQFVEQFSAYLWTTHQMDAFREAATSYAGRLRMHTPLEALPMRRLGIAVIGSGVAAYDRPLFANLRQHGTYFGSVKPDRGLELLLAGVAARANAHSSAYAHWYIDGGAKEDASQLLTTVSYKSLDAVRAALLRNIQTEIAKPGMGPEELRSHLARLSPAAIGLDDDKDPVLDHFQLKVLTEGSGTQIFSTTFAQWTAREALRRAQPLTMLVRYAPRQRQRPMNELLADAQADPEPDLIGSLIDGDMGAYYQWINQQRLAGSEQSSFLVWFEDHAQALVIAPSLPRGTESKSQLDLAALLSIAGG